MPPQPNIFNSHAMLFIVVSLLDLLLSQWDAAVAENNDYLFIPLFVGLLCIVCYVCVFFFYQLIHDCEFYIFLSLCTVIYPKILFLCFYFPPFFSTSVFSCYIYIGILQSTCTVGNVTFCFAYCDGVHLYQFVFIFYYFFFFKACGSKSFEYKAYLVVTFICLKFTGISSILVAKEVVFA